MKKTIIAIIASILFSFSAKADYQDDCINKYRNSIGVDPFVFCPLDESKKLMLDVDKYYMELSELEMLKSWNNGNKMTSGNFKDLKEAWTLYRNKMCSLVATFWGTIEPDDGSLEKQQAECLLREVKVHHAYLKNMIDNKNSSPYTDAHAH